MNTRFNRWMYYYKYGSLCADEVENGTCSGLFNEPLTLRTDSSFKLITWTLLEVATRIFSLCQCNKSETLLIMIWTQMGKYPTLHQPCLLFRLVSMHTISGLPFQVELCNQTQRVCTRISIYNRKCTLRVFVFCIKEKGYHYTLAIFHT